MCAAEACVSLTAVIQVMGLTKRYGRVHAVDALSFEARAGCVTGFLGPNGAGKTTTMRLLLGLAAPDAGQALVGGRRYAARRRPLHEVGALLDATAVQGGRSARAHLRWLARSNGIDRRRVDDLLEQVGLAAVAQRRISGFSLGMKQRLGIAAALLGDPGVLVLDEPVNGLDPDGVRWIRTLLRRLAGEGRTVLVSSHLMTEMELTAERLVLIGRGRLIDDTSLAELTERYDRGVQVRSPRAPELAAVLTAVGGAVTPAAGDELRVTGLGAPRIGDLAAEHGIPVWEVTARRASLEEAYMALTADAVDHRSPPPSPSPASVISGREEG
jgi:ABC-2 type transport system ATP-binding protein